MKKRMKRGINSKKNGNLKNQMIRRWDRMNYNRNNKIMHMKPIMMYKINFKS
jgi:hypothetical protein